MMDPQQELFSLIRQALIDEFNEDMVFDGYMPPENTPYPFIYVADSQLVDSANKSAIFGTINQTVHIWHNNPMQRGTVSDIALRVKTRLRSINGVQFSYDVIGMDQRILSDVITTTPLVHCIIMADFRFS